MEVNVRDRCVDDDGCIYFERAATGEKVAGLLEHPCALLEHGAGRRGLPAHRMRPMGCPTRMPEPAPEPGNHSAARRGNKRITVEPMLNRPISSPRGKGAGWGARS